MSPLNINPSSLALRRHDSTRLQTLTQLADVNFTTYFFSRDKMPIGMNIPGKMCSNRRKNHGCGQKKKQKALTLLYLAAGPLRNAANSRVVPTEFAAEPTTKMKSSKTNLVTWTFRLPPKRQLSVLSQCDYLDRATWKKIDQSHRQLRTKDSKVFS